MNKNFNSLCTAIILLSFLCVPALCDADGPFLVHTHDNKHEPEVEVISRWVPVCDLVISGIPAALGAWGTYHVITGPRSHVDFFRALHAVGKAGDEAPSASVALRETWFSILKNLKPHERTAFIASLMAVYIGAGGVVGCTAASLYYGVKACCASGSTRKKHLHNANMMLAMLANSVAVGTVGLLSLWLLTDYAEAGRAALRV